MPRTALLLATLASLASGCQRTATEDFPPAREASSVVSSHPPVASGPADGVMSPTAYGPAAPGVVQAGAVGSAADAGSAGRCVKPTPAQAPPAVAPGPAPGCPVDPEGGPPKVPVVHVAFPGAGGTAGGPSVDAELVSSDHDTTRGLMYRKNMPEDHGMLFHLRVREDHQFWMHNTCIPLDLLYIDDDGLIVGIAENAPTMSDDTVSVGCPSRYVLEVNAGWTRRHGVKAGQSVKLPPGS